MTDKANRNSANVTDTQREVSAWRLFATLALVLVVSIILAASLGNAVLQTNRKQQHLYAAELRLIELQSTLLDAETGQRGFLLVGTEKYLEPFKRADAQLSSKLKELNRDADEGRINADAWKALSAASDAKMAELRETIRLYREDGPIAAMAVVTTDSGKAAMDLVRHHVAGIKIRLDAEQEQLAHRSASLTTARTYIFVGVTLLNLFCLYRAFRLLQDQANRRRRVAAELAQQKHLLDTTLRSIGDGVILTDPQRRITFINDVAARLCGWNDADVIGRPCEDVFRIINEQSREPVESPVDKVINTGRVVGLANHTLLIRRDGTEVPIDDSGAPIRDEEGILHGVVLVFRDFTQHKNAEAALRAARTSAEAASRAKDNFLATLSHELRTPLTPVMMTLSAWEAGDSLPAGTADEVRMMRRSLDLEARLIDDLLDLTRITRGKLAVKLERADVHALVTAAERMYENDFRSKRIAVDLELAAEHPVALIDPARFQQVLWNVLKNAMKFTPPGGRVRIATEANDGRLRVTVRDTGIGMTPELMSRLFRPFEQSDELRVRRQGGLGLGLAIAKALIERQNGTITATSEGPDRGSTFVIEVPIAQGEPHQVPTSGSAQPPPESPVRLLLVEDHADTALALSRLLRKAGHEVTVADSVAAARQQIDEKTFDILLSDVGLPDGTGVDVVKHLRTKSVIPAIALTGYGMEDDVQQCLKAGFTVHLTKPVNFSKLIETITVLTNLRS